MPKILVAVPCMSMVHTDFMTSLIRLQRLPGTEYTFTVATLIYDSRNAMTVKAIEEEFDRILFIDSDMVFEPDLLIRMSQDMDAGPDYVSGVYFSRKYPVKPMIYKTVDARKAEDGSVRAVTDGYENYPINQVFTIEGSGFGAVMIKTELIRNVWDKYGPPFMPTPIMGEDLAFCWKAKQLGAKMICDSRIKLGHVGNVIFDESMYLTEKESRRG